jgi:hypothetical protein
VLAAVQLRGTGELTLIRFFLFNLLDTLFEVFAGVLVELMKELGDFKYDMKARTVSADVGYNKIDALIMYRVAWNVGYDGSVGQAAYQLFTMALV